MLLPSQVYDYLRIVGGLCEVLRIIRSRMGVKALT